MVFSIPFCMDIGKSWRAKALPQLWIGKRERLHLWLVLKTTKWQHCLQHAVEKDRYGTFYFEIFPTFYSYPTLRPRWIVVACWTDGQTNGQTDPVEMGVCVQKINCCGSGCWCWLVDIVSGCSLSTLNRPWTGCCLSLGMLCALLQMVSIEGKLQLMIFSAVLMTRCSDFLSASVVLP